MDALDKKINDIFPGECVYKTPEKYRIFSGYNIPSFVKDWLIKRYTDGEEIDQEGLKHFLSTRIAFRGSKMKGELINESKKITLLARIIVEPDIASGKLKFSIPDIEIKLNEGRIPSFLSKNHPELNGGESWGVVSMEYVPPSEGGEKGYIEMCDYKPFKPYEVEIEYFRDNRKEFTFIEWVDVLIRSMEYNPDVFDSFTQKLLFISRLLIFVEPNLNMIELAPKGTGKSYVFGNLSKYGWLFSGGGVSRAKLFYDVTKRQQGIITKYDFIAFDEIDTIKFTDEDEVLGALKNYLEFGSFSIANYRGTGTAGLILLGNIPLSENKNPLSNNYFESLPYFFKNSALLDRFHGFIEGWRLPRIKENMKIRGNALNVEYFSEILHSLRYVPDFSSIASEFLDIPRDADTRDTNAIVKLCRGYLKLLFPHARNIDDISKDDFENYCLKPAKEMRSIIKQQISLMDKEFNSKVPDIKIKGSYF